MTVNGKQKGARAEREAAALLHAWWAAYEPIVDGEPLTFKRTPMSGGWSKGSGQKAFGTSADLVTNSKRFPFAVEIKHREGWSYENFLKGGKSPVWSWWDQAMEQADKVGKEPLLMFRKNRAPWFIIVPNYDVFGETYITHFKTGGGVARDVLLYDALGFFATFTR